MEWDKDDEDSMMFVAAAANVRASIFNIEQKTQWKVKEMAGNIIPGKILLFSLIRNFQTCSFQQLRQPMRCALVL